MMLHQEHCILIVDDSFRNLNMMQKLLKTWGYSDCTVDSTEHSLELLQRKNFSLIIVDNVPSGIKQLEVAQMLRAIQPHTPVICSDENLIDLRLQPKSRFRPFQQLKSLLKNVFEDREGYGIIMI